MSLDAAETKQVQVDGSGIYPLKKGWRYCYPGQADLHFDTLEAALAHAQEACRQRRSRIQRARAWEAGRGKEG